MRSVVVAPQPRAVEAGIEVLEQGGNAVDAAVACCFTQGVVDPLMTSLGGFGTMLVLPAKSDTPVHIGFHGRVPFAATPTMFKPLEGEGSGPMATGTWVVENYANQLGYLAATVPGLVAGLCEAHSRFGSLPLSAVVSPAAQIAEEGWLVTARQAGAFGGARAIPGRLEAAVRLAHSPAGRAIYTIDGRPPGAGCLLRNRDYASVLRRIGVNGAAEFYRGETALAIAADFAANGGLISERDLNEYVTDGAPPLHVTYRGYDIYAAPPPAGGLTVLQILNVLEGFDLAAMGWGSPEYVHTVAEAMRQGFFDFARYLGDPEYVDVPADRLLEKAYAAQVRDRLRPGCRSDRLAAGQWPGRGGVLAMSPLSEGVDTTQTTVVDHRGNAVTVTHSIAAAAGIVTPGLGFLFNGQMHRFNPVPGFANSIAPAKRRVTGMAPTLVMKDGKLVMALGSPGGQGIIHGVVQTILHVLDFGMDLQTAVSVPRFHCEQDEVTFEWRHSARTVAAIASWGHPTVHRPVGYDPVLSGRVQAALIGSKGIVGASDPRDDGVAFYTGLDRQS